MHGRPMMPGDLQGLPLDADTGMTGQNLPLAEALSLAKRLPERRHAINLCTGRKSFMAGLLAAVQRRQITLLPSSCAPGFIAEFQENYPDSHILIDDPELDVAGPTTLVDLTTSGATEPMSLDEPAADQVVVIAFTSGSTGKATAHEKSWASVRTGAHLAAECFGLDPATGIVATVPPQHMYGLETSIFYPLFCGCAVHPGRPVFPVEIRDALAALDTEKRLLVTTPIHLKSMIKSEVVWPRVDLVISATAPLSETLARKVEKHLQAPVKEIYGCTEAGSIASRRTVDGDVWKLYRDVTFSATDTDGHPMVHGGHVFTPTPLADRLDLIDRTRFRLLGRSADQVSIAGKRASLGDLNARLLGIDGIEDGAFVARGGDRDGEVRRLGCLYVSTHLDEAAVVKALSGLIDSAFLPRPIRRVERLPRNELGKLARLQLLALLEAPETATARRGKASTSAA
jgi:acyl-coenzyme A synthetase/AMP-(fatty) acid ligase